MKILAICGSHKKGNTYSTLNTIKKIYPDIDVDILMLKDADLKWCLGCYTCVKLGEDKCPLKDDRETIVKKMLNADGVVFASPVYVMHITSLMKNFFERVGYNDHRPCFFGKHAMVVAVCAGFGAKEANKYMKSMVSIFGFNVASSLELKIAAKTEKEKAHNRKKIIKAFDKFVVSIREAQKRTPVPTLTQLVYFKVFKLLSERQKDMYKADYEYYKNKTDYVNDVKINAFKKSLANYMARNIMKNTMKNR